MAWQIVIDLVIVTFVADMESRKTTGKLLLVP